MPTYENTLDNNLASDAEFQAFIQKYEAALLASGFLEVAPDTGQINPLTVVKPAVNVYAGYRVYRAKDSLAATEPLMMKVEYGTGSQATMMQIRRTLGTSSNGAGTMTGVATGQGIVYTPSVAGTGNAVILGGGGPHAAFVYCLDPGVVTQQALWAVGRLLDQEDGSPQDVMWDTFSVSGAVNFATLITWSDGASAWFGISTPGLGIFAPQLSEGIHGGGDINNTLLYQALVYRSGKTMVFPILTGRAAELPFTDGDNSSFSVDIWGGNHTFVPILNAAITASQRIAFLWE